MESQKPATTSWGHLHPHHSSGKISEEECPTESNDDLHHKCCSGSLKKKLRELPTDQPSPTIYKVHNRLRNVNNDAYDPTLVAIGPYHRNQEKLNRMEKKKLQFLQQFLDRGRGEGLSVEVCVSTIQRLKPETQRWYDEPIDLNPAEFVEMLVLDGCFIIEFVLQFLSNSTGMPSWMESGITQDFILFENQIPYCVISELFRLISRRDFSVSLLYLFHSYSYPIKESEGNTGSSEDDIQHVLDLIYRNLVPMPSVSGSTTISKSSEVAESTKDLDLAGKGHQKNEVSCCNRYLWCFSAKVLGCSWCSTCQDNSNELEFISSATRLSKYNVKFRKGEPNGSMFQISFENGTLRLPCLKIYDKTESFLRNLMAYEQHFQGRKKCYVMEFVTLFDCLINDEEDVKLLVKHGIIENWLGSDDVVAHMFNKLCTHVIFNANFAYKGEFIKVKEHCRKRRHAWIANLKQNYFNSPWTGISVMAAFVLLLLTLLHTVFTIIK